MVRDTLPRLLGPLAVTIAVAALVGAVAPPLAHSGYPSGHDATAHLTYTYLFDRALAQAQFPVRWVEWVRPGESQPLFNFYYPGFAYLVSAVHLVVPSLGASLKTAIALLWWAGALFTYAFVRPSGRLPAALASVVFALAPYLILDVFVRAAYAEFAALALAPGVFWASDRILRTGRTSFVPMAAAIGGLMLITHLPSVLIFAPVGAAYVAYLLWTGQTTLVRVSTLLVALVIGFGCATFYVVPALTELHFVAMSRMISGYFDYRLHFVEPAQWITPSWGYGASVEGPDDGMSFHVGVVQSLVVAVCVGDVIVSLVRRRMRPHTGDLIFWLGTIAAVLFVTSAASEPLWRVAKPLSYLQFPWRFLMVVPLACAVLAARLLSAVPTRALTAAAVVAIIAVQYQVARPYLRPLRYIAAHEMSVDYTRWAETTQATATAFIDRGFTPVGAVQEAPEGLGRWSAEGEGQVSEVRVQDAAIVLDIETPSGMALRLNSHYFPGWRASIDGEPADIAVDPQYGFMDLQVPPGTHRVEARFANTGVRQASNAVSAISIALCLAIAGSTSMRLRAAHRAPGPDPSVHSS